MTYRKHTITTEPRRMRGLGGHTWTVVDEHGATLRSGWMNDEQPAAQLRAMQHVDELLGPIDVSIGDEDLALSKAVAALPRSAS